jgi:hypothetical protein
MDAANANGKMPHNSSGPIGGSDKLEQGGTLHSEINNASDLGGTLPPIHEESGEMINDTDGKSPTNELGLIHQMMLGGNESDSNSNDKLGPDGPPGKASAFDHQMESIFHGMFADNYKHPGGDSNHTIPGGHGPDVMMGWDMGLSLDTNQSSISSTSTDPTGVWLEAGVQMVGGGDPKDSMRDSNAFVKLHCPVNEDAPACASVDAGRGGAMNRGTWVCRTWTDPQTGTSSTRSTCVDSHAAYEMDVCGCCDGLCPKACSTCPCNLNGGAGDDADGVWIESRRFQDSIITQSCVPPAVAVTLIAQDAATTTCVEQCPSNE